MLTRSRQNMHTATRLRLLDAVRFDFQAKEDGAAPTALMRFLDKHRPRRDGDAISGDDHDRDFEPLRRSDLDAALLLACAQGGPLVDLELLLAVGARARAQHDGHARAGLLHVLVAGCAGERMDAPARPQLEAATLETMARALVAAGANVEERDLSYGATPLIWAGWYRSAAGATALLRLGADVGARDAFNGTALEYASDGRAGRGDAATAEAIRSHTARVRDGNGPAPPRAESAADIIKRARELDRTQAASLARLRSRHAGQLEERARVAGAMAALAFAPFWARIHADDEHGAAVGGLPAPALLLVARFSMPSPLGFVRHDTDEFAGLRITEEQALCYEWSPTTWPRIPACFEARW